MKFPALSLIALAFFMFPNLWAADPTPRPDDPACTAADRVFMERTYELARDAVKKGNAPFGAVLVVDGKIVAEAENTVATDHDPTKHAEAGLISAFGPKVDRATFARSTLYASSEPCTMCCGAILNAGIPKLVYGVTESQFRLFLEPTPRKNPLTSREIMARSWPHVEVRGPLMEREGLEAHASFWPEALKRWGGH